MAGGPGRGDRDRKASHCRGYQRGEPRRSFSSTLADNKRTMLAIEPLSQSDPANFQLLLFRLTGTHSRVSLFAAPTFCRAKGNVMSSKLAWSVVPTVEAKSNLSQSDGCIRKAWAPIGRSPISFRSRRHAVV